MVAILFKNKMIIAGTFLLIVASIVIYIVLKKEYEKDVVVLQQQIFNMDFQLIKESEFGKSYIYNHIFFDYNNYEPSSEPEYTWWEVINSNSHALESSRLNDYMLPENIDFGTHSILVTYGRKLVKLRYDINALPYHYPNARSAVITFTDEYFSSVAFFYLIDKTSFIDARFYSRYYIMENDEEIYIGLWRDQLNEQKEWIAQEEWTSVDLHDKN